MEYRKIINLLDNTPNQPTKFRTRNWVEIKCTTWSVQRWQSNYIHNFNANVK